MKKLTATLFAFFTFVAIAGATCTVTTDCGERTYTETNISASASNGVVTVTSNGALVETFSCETTSVSTSCSDGDSDGGDFDFGGFDFGSFFSWFFN